MLLSCLHHTFHFNAVAWVALWNLLGSTMDGAVIRETSSGSPTVLLGNVLVMPSTNTYLEESGDSTFSPNVTPQGTGRQGTQEYLMGFIVCLTINIGMTVIVFFFFCYLGRLSRRRDETDAAQPRQQKPWREVLEPVADKVFCRS